MASPEINEEEVMDIADLVRAVLLVVLLADN